jgi:hypothetical protein
MCDSTNIFYGKKGIFYDDSGLRPESNVAFLYSELESSNGVIPEVGDLILNIGTDSLPDGCFYRVKTLDDYLIETVRLTL